MFELNFCADACCGNYIHAEVKHDNGLRSIVEDKGNGMYTVLTFKEWTVRIPLIQNLSMQQAQDELQRVAALPSAD